MGMYGLSLVIIGMGMVLIYSRSSSSMDEDDESYLLVDDSRCTDDMDKERVADLRALDVEPVCPQFQ